MKLTEYVGQGRGLQGDLCRQIGAHPPDMSRWVKGERGVPPDQCSAIERATAGVVTCEELRGDLPWVRIPDARWPHPGGRPALDVARARSPDGQHVSV